MHTPAYLYDSAETFLKRNTFKSNSVPVPEQFLAPLILVPKPNDLLPLDNSVKQCRLCRKAPSNKKCIETLCLPCCKDRGQAAQTGEAVVRQACKPHSVSEVGLSTPRSSPTKPSTPLRSALSTPPTSQIKVVSPSHRSSPIKFASVLAQPTLPIGNQTQIIGSASQTPHITVTASSSKSLAQPIAPEWLQEYRDAQDKSQQAEFIKTRQIELHERLKRTYELVIFYKVCY